MPRCKWLWSLGFLGLLGGCTAIQPYPVDGPEQVITEFTHDDFDRVLAQYVNDQGQVDYSTLQQHPGDLEAYYALVARYSPDSAPQLFLDDNARLAYWINAYNAAAIKIVLQYYPLAGVGDVDSPSALFFVPGKWRFFVFNRPRFGGVATSLYYLENSVIRERFNDPRVHFALNCASIGCPHLPRRAFNGPQLQHQLDFETRNFFAQPRNFRIDHKKQTVWLSSILDWYRDDFIGWLQSQDAPKRKYSLLDYVARYVDVGTATELQGPARHYKLEFFPYDWKLNDTRTLQ